MKRCARLAWLVLLAGPVQGEAHITGLRVAQKDQQLHASFQLVDAFDPTLLARIQSGLPTEVRYRFKLERPHRWWFDNTVRRSNLQVVVKYNAVTREYLINFKHDGRLIESRVVNHVDELEDAMTVFRDLPILALDDLSPSGRVVLRVRADLGSRNILLLIPTKIHTDWAESDRFRVEPGES